MAFVQFLISVSWSRGRYRLRMKFIRRCFTGWESCFRKMKNGLLFGKMCIRDSTSLGTWPIEHFGTEEQKNKYLPDLCTGKKLAAFGLTEPNAGTDAAGQQTTAVKDGDDYILNGTKIFITNAGEADVYVIFAMTDKTKGTHGISAFIVEKGMPGFTVGQHEKKLGIRGSATSELIFNNVRLSKDHLLGQEGKGFKIAMMTLDGGRIGIAAQALGIAQGAIDETVPYVKARKQFGRSIAKFQNTQFQLADMQVKTDAARWLVYDAAMKKEKGLPYSVEAAKAKLFAAEVAMEVTTKAIQLMGGYGYTRDYPVERTVSYTHLDVYKRQIWSFLRAKLGKHEKQLINTDRSVRVISWRHSFFSEPFYAVFNLHCRNYSYVALTAS